MFLILKGWGAVFSRAQESPHTPGSRSELEGSRHLVPVDLVAIQLHEAHLGRFGDLFPALGHHVGDEASVIWEVRDLLALIFERRVVVNHVLGVVEVESELPLGIHHGDHTVSEFASLLDEEGGFWSLVALCFVLPDAFDELLSSHESSWGCGDVV